MTPTIIPSSQVHPAPVLIEEIDPSFVVGVFGPTQRRIEGLLNDPQEIRVLLEIHSLGQRLAPKPGEVQVMDLVVPRDGSGFNGNEDHMVQEWLVDTAS